MKLIKNGFRRLQRRLGNSSIEFSFRQLIESVRARVIIRMVLVAMPDKSHKTY
jgi:hypothetical protein